VTSVRTEQNAIDSDETLILNVGHILSGAAFTIRSLIPANFSI